MNLMKMSSKEAVIMAFNQNGIPIENANGLVSCRSQEELLLFETPQGGENGLLDDANRMIPVYKFRLVDETFLWIK